MSDAASEFRADQHHKQHANSAESVFSVVLGIAGDSRECYSRRNEEPEQEKFVFGLRRYIRRVVAEIPSGELPQNMTEKSDSADDMIAALDGMIREIVQNAMRD